MNNAFALNHMVAPRKPLAAFFDLAVALGLTAVEIRNDLAGTAIVDGTPADTVRAEAEKRGLTILSINALYPFNMWTPALADKARDLIAYAEGCGARAIVMCPLNDAAYTAGDAERLASLRTALTNLAPLLRDAGVVGLIEPLGFAECSLRLKREAVEAIDAVNGGDVFKLVHDTFHHVVAGETAMFPERTGLVHISGVGDPAVPVAAMRDPHRILVDATDRLDNLGQMKALAKAGYAGPFSMEPFADDIAGLPDARAAVEQSLAYLRDGLVGSP